MASGNVLQCCWSMLCAIYQANYMELQQGEGRAMEAELQAAPLLCWWQDIQGPFERLSFTALQPEFISIWVMWGLLRKGMYFKPSNHFASLDFFLVVNISLVFPSFLPPSFLPYSELAFCILRSFLTYIIVQILQRYVHLINCILQYLGMCYSYFLQTACFLVWGSQSGKRLDLQLDFYTGTPGLFWKKHLVCILSVCVWFLMNHYAVWEPSPCFVNFLPEITRCMWVCDPGFKLWE